MKTTLLALLLALLALAAGCGGGDDDDLPDGVVAEVGDSEISKDEYDSMLVAVTINRGGDEGVACVKAWRKEGRDASAACTRQFERQRASTMRALIRDRWYAQEAEERGVKVDDAALALGDEIEGQLATKGVKAEDMRRFLHYVSLNQQLTTQEVEKATKDISEQEIRDFYESIKERFHEPEQRYVRSVVAASEAEAKRAKAALEDGQTWERVTTQFADGDVETQWNGLLVNVYRVGDDALEKAAYKAKKNEIGVVKSQQGWYVFQLKEIQPESQEPLSAMREYVIGQVRLAKQERVIKRFNLALRKKYGDETRCASDYEVPDCAA